MKKVCLVFGIFFSMLSFLCFGSYVYYRDFDIDKLTIKDVSYADNTFKIKVSNYYGNLYCAVSRSSDNLKWERFSDNDCEYKINDFGNYKIYLKNSSGVRKINNINKVFYSSLNTKKFKYYRNIN